jgi:hypothetical protein
MSENNVLSEEIVNDVINQCIDNYTNDKNEEKIETHTDKEDNNEVEINEEFAPEDYAYDEKDIESKKNNKHISAEQFVIQSKIQTENALLNLGETMALKKFQKAQEEKDFNNNVQKLQEFIEKYHNNENNIHSLFKKKKEEKFNEIMNIIYLTHTYQVNKIGSLNDQFDKIKSEYDDLKEELDEANNENIELEEKIEKLEETEKLKIGSIIAKYKNKINNLEYFSKQLIFLISISTLNFLIESIIPDIYCTSIVLFVYSFGTTLKQLTNFTELFFSFNNIYSLVESSFIMFFIGYIYYYLYSCIYFILNKIKKMHLKN